MTSSEERTSAEIEVARCRPERTLLCSETISVLEQILGGKQEIDLRTVATACPVDREDLILILVAADEAAAVDDDGEGEHVVCVRFDHIKLESSSKSRQVFDVALCVRGGGGGRGSSHAQREYV